MNALFLRIFLFTLALAGLSMPAAADLQSGVNAYESGDYETALEELSAENVQEEHPRAQYLLGVMYRDGLGVDTNQEMGVRYLESAAEQGNGGAQAALGRMYAEGVDGLEENDRMAYLWLHDAVDQGHVDSMQRLGQLYRDGDGTRQNFVLAYQWFLTAYMLGDREQTATMGKLRGRMSEEQISIGEQLALDWVERKRATGQDQGW